MLFCVVCFRQCDWISSKRATLGRHPQRYFPLFFRSIHALRTLQNLSMGGELLPLGLCHNVNLNFASPRVYLSDCMFL